MKHLLSTRQLSKEEALLILDTAEEMAVTQQQQMKKLPTLRGKTVVNLFFEDSTRTRISFEAAAKRLSADVINFSAKGSSTSKGESLTDTVKTLAALGADGIVIRHPSSGAAEFLAQQDLVPGGVVNAGDGTHEHPTQALLDAFTIRQRRIDAAVRRGSDLGGVRVLIVGDISHSRVARSNIWLLTLLGAKVAIAAPATLIPPGASNWPLEIFYDFDRALQEFQPEVVMMLRVQQERMSEAFFPSAAEYGGNWGLSEQRFATLPTSTLIMHPGPMNRGLEIAPAAADSAQSTVIDQVRNGVSVRMAVLYLTLAAAGSNSPVKESL